MDRELRFYHLTRRSFDDALVRLLGKAWEQGRRAVVRLDSQEQLDHLNAWLWTYRNDSFLPHGGAREGYGSDQPIWLTTGSDQPNGAQVAFATVGASFDNLESLALICVLFSGHDDEAVGRARELYRWGRRAGLALSYWQESPEGGWQKRHEEKAAPAET